MVDRGLTGSRNQPRRLHRPSFGGALILASCIPAAAEIVDSSPAGFAVQETAHIASDPQTVYAALTRPADWWSPVHTFSADAANLTLDARAGGCWCERMPGGGSALHLTVVDAEPGKTLRLRGAMGPLQAMAVDGAMTWSLAPASGGADVTLDVAFGGYAKGWLEPLSQIVDRVMGEQVAELGPSFGFAG